MEVRNPIPRQPARASYVEQLPVEILREITGWLPTADVVTLGQTGWRMRQLIRQPEILRPKIRGEDGPLCRRGMDGRPDALWQRALADGSFVTNLRRAPLVLPELDPSGTLALSESGRFVVNQRSNGDIVALDLLSLSSPTHVLALAQPHLSSFKFWDREGFLWGVSGSLARLWQAGHAVEPRAHFQWQDGAARVRVGNKGRTLVRYDVKSKKLCWFRAEDLLTGDTSPAGTKEGVEAFAVARSRDRLAIVKGGLLAKSGGVFDLESMSLRSRADIGAISDSRMGWTVQLWNLSESQLLEEQSVICDQAEDEWQRGFSVYLSADGRRVAASPHNLELLAWPCSDWKDLVPNCLGGLCGCGIDRLDMSVDGRFLSFIGFEGDMHFHDLERVPSSHIYASSSGGIFWLHAFSGNVRYLLFNNSRVLLSSPYEETQNDDPAAADTTNAESEETAGTASGPRWRIDMNLMAEEFGGELQSLPPQIDESEAQGLLRRHDGRYKFGECIAIEPDGAWGLAQTDESVVAFALGGTTAYLGQVVDTLIPLVDEELA